MPNLTHDDDDARSSHPALEGGGNERVGKGRNRGRASIVTWTTAGGSFPSTNLVAGERSLTAKRSSSTSCRYPLRRMGTWNQLRPSRLTRNGKKWTDQIVRTRKSRVFLMSLRSKNRTDGCRLRMVGTTSRAFLSFLLFSSCFLFVAGRGIPDSCGVAASLPVLDGRSGGLLAIKPAGRLI